MSWELESPELNQDGLRALIRAMDLRTPGQGMHAERVAVYATATGERMGLRFDELIDLRRAAALHDVGKLELEPHLFRRVAALGVEEADELRLLALAAETGIDSYEWLRPSLVLVRHQHEHWDGSGTPDGLKRDQIPIGSRILAVAEAYDVMTSAWGTTLQYTEASAIANLEAGAGHRYDPAVVRALRSVVALIQPLAS